MTYLRLIPQSLPKSTSKSRPSSTFLYSLHLACHVKPNSKAHHDCITVIRPDKIGVSVSAAPRDGDANRAVARVFAEVLNVPPSDVEVIRGEKSREKVLRVRDWGGIIAGRQDEGEVFRAVQGMLEKACTKS